MSWRAKHTTISTAADHWSQVSERTGPLRTRWWQHPRIVAHINRIICGHAAPGIAAGDIALLRDWVPGHTFAKAVSVGCGNGAKEMALLDAGLVQSFDLYEISDKRIRDGQALAARKGLTDRLSWHEAVVDFTATDLNGSFDLVYWNNALHHMLDVEAAVKWSKLVAREGGYLYVNDFVGPSRMQWTDESLNIASRVRAGLPERLLQRPSGQGLLARTLARPDVERLMSEDPTESAQSGQIIGAIRRSFPSALIKLTGGIVYHLALNDVLANLTEDDTPLLDQLLLLDEVCAEAGHTHYAVALAPAWPVK